MFKMKLFLICVLFVTNVLILPINVLCVFAKNELQANIEHLTNNFFANLQEDPYLKDKILSDSSKAFIDKQVANYMALIKQTHGLFEHSVTRRSLPIEDVGTLTRDNEGVYILDGFVPLYNIKARFPKDMVLFKGELQGKEMWFAAALECRIGKKASHLVVYAFTDSKLVEIIQIPVINGIKLGVYSTSTSHFLVVAESKETKTQYQEESAVYEFDGNEFTKIQTLKRRYASDVAIWEEKHQVFMSITQYMKYNDEEDSSTFEVNTPIYKWLGKHFDVMQHIKTYGAKRITPFVIGNSHFVAVANFRNDFGDTNIYSEIFKHNLHTDQFESYQKILTNAAVDVKYFYFQRKNVRENFLVFANLFEMDADGSKNYDTDSIVYKYVEDYFIPFQSFKLSGATEWLPVTGAHGEFVLLVACKFEGIKAFQYDGWKFVESQLSYTNEAFSKGVASMRSYSFHGKPIIVIANENDDGNMKNMFEPTFVHQNMLTKFQNEMLSWCKQSLQDFQFVDFETITKQVEEAPKNDDLVLQLPQGVSFDEVTIENLHTLESNETDSEQTQELDELETELNADIEELDLIEKQVEMSLHTTGVNVFSGDVHVQKLVLNSNESFFESVTVETINDMEVSQVLRDVININKGFKVENAVKFDSITVENELHPKSINGHAADSLSNQTINERLYDLIVEGNAVLKEGLIVDESLNGINFTKENILLCKGDQELTNFHIDNLKAEKFDAKFLNNIDMAQMNSQNAEKLLIESINNLNVKSVFLGGYINKVDVPTLNKYALRTFGDQIITGEYTFDSLHVANLNLQTISGKRIPDDFILINGGTYKMGHNIQFLNELNVNAVDVTDNLNKIKVVNGQLDVLLVNVAHVQHITGYKEFENVELLNPIRLQGKINSPRMEQMNPMTIVEGEIILTGDYIISGDVKIQELIETTDLLSPSLLSVQRLQERGIKITDTVIPVHLNFSQQLNVAEIFTDEINEVEVNSLIITDSIEPQIITGWKQFQGDVHILGPTNLDTVNGIDLHDLEMGVLKISGNQTLSGKYHFENVIAHRVYNVRTEFSENLWENVITTYGNQNIGGTTLIGESIQADVLEAHLINCNTINGYDFTNLVNDTVLFGQDLEIQGHKQFTDLSVENLVVPSLDLNKLPTIIENTNASFQFDEDVQLPENIVIKNILFSQQFNNIPRESFDRRLLFDGREQFVENDQNFKKITVHGELIIVSDLINGVRILDLKENSVKTDEYFEFGSVTFKNGLTSLKRVTLSGQFESLDVDDIVQSESDAEQILKGQITFNGDVNVYGQLLFSDLVSGINLNDICRFAFAGEGKSLRVNGNVYFAMGPQVYRFNNREMPYIFQNVWFKDRDISIIESMEFDQVLFSEDLIVQGFIDEIKIELIAQTYFSKTRDQNVSAFLDFDDVMFASEVYAKRASVGGNVGGINLEEFTRTALLNGYQQTFENTVYLEECRIQDLHGEFNVNGFNLETDVARYSSHNIITGRKVIYNVHALAVYLPRPYRFTEEVYIQGVPLLKWLETAVLKNGTYEITGGVAFENYTTFENGISSELGLVNGMKFGKQTIMMKSFPQNITAPKIFAPQILTENESNSDNISHPVQFQSVMLMGHLNGVNMTELMNNQAYKNQDTIFESPVNFNGNLTTSNVNMENLYQGMNVTEVVSNATRFESAKDYYDGYEKLLNASNKVKDSLQEQAYFLDHYQVKEVYEMVQFVLPVALEFTDAQFLARVMIGVHNYSVNLDIWDKEGEYFRNAFEPLLARKELRYIKPIKFRNQELWYMEHKNDFSDFDLRQLTGPNQEYEGSIYRVAKDSLMPILPSILHQGSKTVASVTIPDDNKDCLVMVFEITTSLYCVEQGPDGQFLKFVRTLEKTVVNEVATYVIDDIPYIFTINPDLSQEQPHVNIWRFNRSLHDFVVHQVIYVTSPNSITVVSYRDSYYLAIASGHVEKAKHPGLIDIRRFDKDSQNFVTVQELKTDAPLDVEFAELPSKELVLYVLMDNPIHPLVVYEYLGISGFKKKIVASTVPKIISIMSYTSTRINQHFILVQSKNEIRLILAVFKGKKMPV